MIGAVFKLVEKVWAMQVVKISGTLNSLALLDGAQSTRRGHFRQRLSRNRCAPASQTVPLALLHVEVLDLQRVLLDEFPAWLDIIPHKSGKQVIGRRDV